MADPLAEGFQALIEGRLTAGAFVRHLLTQCSASPERGWEALALLDRAYRQRRVSDELCRNTRQRIGAIAMQREGFAVEPVEPVEALPREQDAIDAPRRTPELPAPAAAPAPAPAAAHPASPPPPMPPRPSASRVVRARAAPAAPRGWARRGMHSSPALALVCAVLGVAASTNVQDPPATQLTPSLPEPDPAPAADSAAPQAALVSLSSDRYVVRARQRTLEITVQRSGNLSAASSFRWWTQPASAHSGDDYLGTRDRLVTLQPGEDIAHLSVRILPNPHRRHIEMFYVAIGGAGNGAETGEIRRAAVFVFPDQMP